MATWHQQRARTRLYHDTQWSVVSDPPHDCTAITLCDTEAEARAFLARLTALGKASHTYILAPANKAKGESTP